MPTKLALKFWTKPSANKEQDKIYLRITVARKKKELYTGRTTSPKGWDENREQTKKDQETNKALAQLKAEAYDYETQLEQNNKPVTAASIKQLLTGDAEVKVRLLPYFRKFIERKLEGGEIKRATVGRYQNTCDHLENFIKEQFGGADLRVDQVDYNFIKEFDAFLLKHSAGRTEKKTLDRNTVNRYMGHFRTLMKQAFHEGHVSTYPFGNFKLKNTPRKVKFLDEDELMKLQEHDLGGNESLQRVRDIFLFSVYTGLRYSDAIQMRPQDIKKNGKGELFFTIQQAKTQEPLRVPLLPQAQAIVEKYQNEQRQITGRILPQCSNPKVNAYLKVIADLVGIEKKITHHVARHTCATFLLSQGQPMDVVKAWLGHSDVKTTQVYAHLTNTALQKAGKAVAASFTQLGANG